MLVGFCCFGFLSGQSWSQQKDQSRSSRSQEIKPYVVSILEEGITAPPQERLIDLDNDGIQESVLINNDIISISYADGRVDEFNPEPSIQDYSIVILDPQQRFPSFVLAVGSWEPYGSGNFIFGHKQMILYNKAGRLSLQELDLWLVGRSVE